MKSDNITILLTLTDYSINWGSFAMRTVDITTQGFDIEYWNSWEGDGKDIKIGWLAI